MSKKGGGIDLSMLKFATGNMMKKDDDDDQLDGMGGFGNNPIMWHLLEKKSNIWVYLTVIKA